MDQQQAYTQKSKKMNSIIRVLIIFPMVILFSSNKIFSQSNQNKMEQSEAQKNGSRILVILTLDMENIPSNFQEILKHEREVVAQWKQEGILEQLFLRPTKNGAVLILKNIDEAKANELIKTLPFYALKKSVEILPLLKDPEM
jgi:hypothetical protein